MAFHYPDETVESQRQLDEESEASRHRPENRAMNTQQESDLIGQLHKRVTLLESRVIQLMLLVEHLSSNLPINQSKKPDDKIIDFYYDNR